MFALAEPSGRVAQVAAQQFPVAPALVWVDASAHPSIDTTWTCINGVLAPPAAAPAATLAQQAAAALGAGLTVASTGTPAIDGTYACDDVTWADALAISHYISVNGRFPAGAATLAWPDIHGAAKTFPTVALFQSFATALGDYVTPLKQIKSGLTAATALPPSSVALA